jgi:glycosyltransferase involved in cell wall biosynthesis
LKRLTLVTDAWHPQTNGVVNTLTRLVKDLAAQGTDVQVISPEGHKTVPLPSYSEYKIAVDPWKAMPRIRAFKPDAIHIATEGPLGFWANAVLRRRGLRFTTSFHTRFPEYLSARVPLIPLAFGYCIERWFHRPAQHTLVGTVSLMKELDQRRIGGHLVHWPRGVDLDRFHPSHRKRDVYAGLSGPIWLYVGRVAAEKTLADFLKLPLPGTKVVVGDGPEREPLTRRFPGVVWRGYRYGEELAAHFASADCFVFPSRTETFGNVILEALASGVPVASVPAPGPIDLLQDGINGAVDDDLHAACMRAIRCMGTTARESTRPYTYRASHDRFRSYLVPLIPRLPASSELPRLPASTEGGNADNLPASPALS